MLDPPPKRHFLAIFRLPRCRRTGLRRPVDQPAPRYVSALMDVLSSDGCQWAAADDDLCVLVFPENGFVEYDGDIVTAGSIEFYSIEVEEDGRYGTWRVTYDDGSTVDAEYRFYQNRQAGCYSIESDAFPTHKVYKSKAFTSGDVLGM